MSSRSTRTVKLQSKLLITLVENGLLSPMKFEFSNSLQRFRTLSAFEDTCWAAEFLKLTGIERTRLSLVLTLSA
jgi:hypothetical protein